MSQRFITRLPRGAEEKDFRVIAVKNGYGGRLTKLETALRSSLQATFELVAQRDYKEVFVRVTVNSDTIARDGDERRFDGSIGELLDDDGNPTGNFYELRLSVYDVKTHPGQTVGVLRMKHIASLPTAC